MTYFKVVGIVVNVIGLLTLIIMLPLIVDRIAMAIHDWHSK